MFHIIKHNIIILNEKKIIYFCGANDLCYNKTSALINDLSGLSNDFKLHVLPYDNKKNIFLARLKQRFLSYVNVYFAYKNHIFDYVILSEFKYSIINLMVFRVFSILHGAKLISGPHVLKSDALYFSFDDIGLKKNISNAIYLRYLAFCDTIKICFVDILQSYTPEYLKRIKSTAPNNKECILFPIRSDIKRIIKYNRSKLKPNGVIRIIFWGNAGPLHGLEKILFAISMLKEKGLKVEFDCYTRSNKYVQFLIEKVRFLKIDDVVLFIDKSVSENFELVNDYDIAVSHLISNFLSEDALDACNSVSTNKMFELIDLNMPFFIYDNSISRNYLTSNQCFFVKDEIDIVDNIINIVRNPDILKMMS